MPGLCVLGCMVDCARCVQQQFHPGKLFGRRPAPSAPDYKAHDIGAKLAVGFEILAARAHKVAFSPLPNANRQQSVVWLVCVVCGVGVVSLCCGLVVLFFTVAKCQPPANVWKSQMPTASNQLMR